MQSGSGQARRKRGSRQQGFTLIELLVTISVIAILLAIGVPYFSDATLGSTLSSYANSLAASAYLARGEAIKTNGAATLCVSSNGTSCGGGGWEQGWIVFRDPNRNAAVDGGEAVIQVKGALAPGMKIDANPAATSFTFLPTGVGVLADATAVTVDTTLTVCRLTPNPGTQERVVRIGVTGLPSVTRTTTGACS